MTRRTSLVLAAVALVGTALATVSCRTVHPRRDPTGETFPAVRGETLSGDAVEIPSAFRGRPVLLLIGYLQDTQFDIDRWLLALADAGAPVDVREVPAIPGLVPRVIGGWIDGQMRRGIPSEDWGSVVTVYGDAPSIAAFTGNQEGLPARVVLLDAEGRVAFFHDRGFSAGAFARLRSALAGDAAPPR